MFRNTTSITCLAIALFCVTSHSQEVVRWGGSEDAEDPDGFAVTSFTWEQSSVLFGASTFQLGLDDSGIRVPELDPNFNLATLGQPLPWSRRDAVFDGDPETKWSDIGFSCKKLRNGCDDIYASVGTYELDLGVLFPVNRIVIMSGLDDAGLTVGDFRLHFNRETPSTGLWCCGLFHPVHLDVRDNRQQVREVLLPGLEPVRFMQISVGEREEGWEIHDIQVFGRGFVEGSTYISNILEFDGPVAWGQMRWAGHRGEGARVMLQTRTGSDPDPDVYWRFSGRGSEKIEVTRSEYEGLSVGEVGGTTYDRSNWSFWSAPYDFADSSGVGVVSPGPRRYFQFRVDLIPGREGGELRHLELESWPPVASALVGEVWPVSSAVGEQRQYTYSLRPTIAAGDAGFDHLEIESLALFGDIRDVRIGDASVAWEQKAAESHRIVIGLPHLEARDSGALVEVDFDAQVLRYGSTFDGLVWFSDSAPLTPQRVNPGDATGEFEGNRVSVATSERDAGLLRVSFEKRLLTPNGDGVNDSALLTYEIFEVIGAPTVFVGIYDLAGRRVRGLHEGPEGVGRYERRFDGRDDAGQMLPPGLYLARVALSTDEAASAEHTEVLYIVY